MDWKSITLIVTLVCASALPQSMTVSFPPGQVIPRVVCAAHPNQSYSLYLPGSFAANQRWPIIYAFDPGARGTVAVGVMKAAAEKYGYIVAASNNSKNGPQGNPSEAAQAMWADTEQRLPINPARRYFAGMSGGARVATALATNCHGCVAGVIANAAGPLESGDIGSDMKYAYFAAVGDADMTYPEFVALRPKLNAAGTRYRIRTFAGVHGWAPPAVWDEALNWMDLQAMARGLLARDVARIQSSLAEDLSRARDFEQKQEWLAAQREYQDIVRNFAALADTTSAANRQAELQKNKEVQKQTKQEQEDVAQQSRLTSPLLAQLEHIRSGDLDTESQIQLRDAIAGLKQESEHTSNRREKLVRERALWSLLIEASELGQRSMEQKDYATALQYFDLASEGPDSFAWARYQRARAFAGRSDKKHMYAELRQSLKAGFHTPAALAASEFDPYRKDPEFQELSNEWAKAAP